MKKSIFSILLLLFTLAVQAQIQEPVKFKSELRTLQAGEAEVIFTGTIDKGWHVYSTDLGEGGPISATFNVEDISGAELVGKLKPVGKEIAAFDKLFEMKVRYFENTAQFVQKLKLTGGAYKVEGYLEYGACNDENCLPPTQVPFKFSGNAEGAAANEPVADATADMAIIGGAEGTTGINVSDKGTVDLWKPVVNELRALGETTSQEDMSWIYIFITGFVGGLLALFTPCVWPIIPMTVSFFLKRSKDKKKGIRDAWTYGASIVVIYVGLGLLVTGLFGANALNSLSTNAVFNIFFFLMLVVFAASFFGAFEITLPSKWSNAVDSKAEKTGGLLSIFLMAFTLSLVSFSCTGPIIGFLLVQVSTTGNMIAPAIGMLGFAIALALPFTLFALFPSWLKSMPKSGGWMNVIKVTLGFLELAFALKFLSVADLAYGWRILDRETFLALWIVLFALLGFYLLGKLRFAHDSEVKTLSVGRLALAIVDFAFVVYMIPGMWGAPLKALSGYLPPLQTQDFILGQSPLPVIGGADGPTSIRVGAAQVKYGDFLSMPHGITGYFEWNEALAAARAAGKPLFVDVTGHGCVNCREMEQKVLSDERVQQILRDDYIVVALYTDDKARAAGEDWVTTESGTTLKEIGRINSYIARTRFNVNAQPNYIVADAAGAALLPPRGYDLSVEGFVDFLERGVAAYKARTQP